MTDESDINNVIDDSDNFIDNTTLISIQPNIIKLVIVNNSRLGMVRQGINMYSGKIFSCTNGNGFVGSNSVVTYFIENTSSENVYCTLFYENSVADYFNITIHGSLFNTPADQYVSIEKGPQNPPLMVSYIGTSGGFKTYVIYNDNPKD